MNYDVREGGRGGVVGATGASFGSRCEGEERKVDLVDDLQKLLTEVSITSLLGV